MRTEALFYVIQELMGRPTKIVMAALSVMSLPALLTEFADCARTKVGDEYSQTLT